MRFKLDLVYLALCAFVTFQSGCAVADPTFVVYRDVPENPTFVVLPATNYLYQVEFANTVEAVIIRAGAKVVDRPGTKEIVSESKLGQAQVQGGVTPSGTDAAGAKEAEAKRTERYFEYGEINADYIVQTYADAKQVRIIKKDTGEILAVIESDYPGSSSSSFVDKSAYGGYKIHKALESMGIPVKPAKPKFKIRR